MRCYKAFLMSLSMWCPLISFAIAQEGNHQFQASMPQDSVGTLSQGLDELGWMTTIDLDAEEWEEAYETLSELYEHKINLNAATREDFEQLPFLTEQQIEQLCEYLYRYGPMRSLIELAMIESLDEHTRQSLLPFVYLGEEPAKRQSLADMLKYGHHELTATFREPFYERKGDKNGYLGYQYRHSVRYVFNYGQKLKIGLVGAQDAGEPFFANRNKWGYDHYSFYAVARQLGSLKTVAVGRYRLRFGMGLVMNTNFNLGKLTALSSLGRSYNHIQGHSSRTQHNYLQGGAATIGLSKTTDLTGFVSYRDIDATLTDDGAAVATILTTGYHRTPSEMQRKENASEFIGGGRIGYRKNGFHIGVSAVYDAFDKPLQPNTSQVYRRIYPDGKEFWNAGTDYGFTSYQFTFSGETALGGENGIATVNTMSYKPAGDLSLMALQRFYSYKYYALHAASFSDGGDVQNESGVLVGATWQVSPRWTIMAYTDYAYFPWARYQVSKASHSWDNLISATWKKRNWNFYARYRLRLRERDDELKTGLVNRMEQRGRASLTYTDRSWQFHTQLDVSDAQQSPSPDSFGWMVSENVSYEMGTVSLNACLSYFHTDDYDSRLYYYERGPLYSFSFPSLYGHGIRYVLFARAKISRNLLLIAKLGTTNYFDRNKISSGLQEIGHSSQTDLDLQLRWKF